MFNRWYRNHADLNITNINIYNITSDLPALDTPVENSNEANDSDQEKPPPEDKKYLA